MDWFWAYEKARPETSLGQKNGAYINIFIIICEKNSLLRKI